MIENIYLQNCNHSLGYITAGNPLFSHRSKCTFVFPPIPPPPPPKKKKKRKKEKEKKCITIVFDFSWDDRNTQEKLETIVIQIMVYVKMINNY